MNSTGSKVQSSRDRQIVEALFHHSPDLHLALNSQGQVVFANPVCLTFLKKSSEECLGHHVAQLGCPEALVRTMELHRVEAHEVGTPKRIEMSFQDNEGQNRRCEVTLISAKSDAQNEWLLLVTVKDLTDRWTSEKSRLLRERGLAILNERENFRALFRETPEMVCILSGPEHRFEFVNEAHVRVLGFDATGLTVREAQPESVEVHGILDEVYRTGQTAELFEIPVTVGTRLRYFNLTYAARRDFQGRVSGIMILGIEVTEHVQFRQQMKDSEARFRHLAETLPQLVWSADSKGEVDYYNHRVSRYAGIKQVDGIWKWEGLVHPLDQQKTRQAWDRAVEAKTEYECEHRIEMSDGSHRWHLSRATPELDSSGRVVRWFGTATDIHDQKVAEAQLAAAKEEAEKSNQLKSAFLANMSHEIRTPLGAILGFTDLLMDSETGPVEKENFHQIIRRNGEQLSNLIDDILDLSKIEAGHLQTELRPVAIRELLDDIGTSLQRKAVEKGLRFAWQVESTVPEWTQTDSTRLRQILINIVGNAIKFTESGEVQVQVQKESSGFLRFRIRDTGVGVDSQKFEKLFKPFSQADESITRQFGGTGLGLALSKRLAEALGGQLALVQSQHGVGSTFDVRIPHRPVPLDALEAQSREVETRMALPTSKGQLEGLRVLLVEDSPDNQIMISRILHRAGAQMEIAHNGEEALHKAQAARYDIVLMDLQMPSMDGITATLALKEKGFQTPVIALTAHAFQEVREKCREIGCCDYLTKPVHRDELISKISVYGRP